MSSGNHIEYDRHYYSVPVSLMLKKVDVRATATTIEIFRNRVLVAAHCRSFRRGQSTTKPEHRPTSHREYGEWSPSRVLEWAKSVSPDVGAVVDHIMRSKRHPEEGYRASVGVIRLGKRYGNDRLAQACQRALALKSASYKTVSSMLKAGLESTPGPNLSPAPQTMPPDHANVRGAGYYN